MSAPLVIVATLAGIAALIALGARIPVNATRALILISLLFVPDLPSGHTLGLIVSWSSGLTLTNYVVPALALPLLLGAWFAGRQLAPERWPAFATWMLVLLSWSLLTLLPPAVAGDIHTAGAATLALHWLKLVLFLSFGVVLAGREHAWRVLRDRLLFLAIAVNAVVGLAQASGALQAASPLARTSGTALLAARASGLFYDANMYGILAAWALLWLLCQISSRTGLRAQFFLTVLTLAVAANLLASGSRAGFAAFGVGLLVLLRSRLRGSATIGLGLAAAALLLFPALSGVRIQAALAAAFSPWLAAPAVAAAHGDASSRERLESMAEALRQSRLHPALGAGFGRALYLGLPALNPSPAAPPGRATFRGAQDMPLTVLAASGPIGLGLLLVALVAPLRRRLSPPMLAGYAGLLVACLTLEVLWNARILALVVPLTSGAAGGGAA